MGALEKLGIIQNWELRFFRAQRKTANHEPFLKVRLHRRFLLRSFSFRCMRLNGLTYECIRPSVQRYIN